MATFCDMGRTRAARATAVRRALAAKQERDAKRLERERAIEEALTDFYEHIEQATQIRRQATERAERIIAAAENEVLVSTQRAAAAITRLHDLGESRTAIADLTGLSLPEVRETLAERQTMETTADMQRVGDLPPLKPTVEMPVDSSKEAASTAIDAPENSVGVYRLSASPGGKPPTNTAEFMDGVES